MGEKAPFLAFLVLGVLHYHAASDKNDGCLKVSFFLWTQRCFLWRRELLQAPKMKQLTHEITDFLLNFQELWTSRTPPCTRWALQGRRNADKKLRSSFSLPVGDERGQPPPQCAQAAARRCRSVPGQSPGGWGCCAHPHALVRFSQGYFACTGPRVSLCYGR